MFVRGTFFKSKVFLSNDKDVAVEGKIAKKSPGLNPQPVQTKSKARKLYQRRWHNGRERCTINLEIECLNPGATRHQMGWYHSANSLVAPFKWRLIYE